MEISKTTLQDVDTVLDVFAAAKRYMRANGNASQWGDEYPDRSIVTYDIACGSSYVMLENGEIVGTFALFLGEDESYRVIEDGAWQMIFGVNTLPEYRKHGYAGQLLRRAIDDARQQHRKGLVLTCKEHLLPYYAQFGFRDEGVSDKSTHGNVVWHQMRLTF